MATAWNKLVDQAWRIMSIGMRQWAHEYRSMLFGIRLTAHFSSLKDILRRAGERTGNGQWSIIDKLVDIFQPKECANYFRSCGYDPD